MGEKQSYVKKDGHYNQKPTNPTTIKVDNSFFTFASLLVHSPAKADNYFPKFVMDIGIWLISDKTLWIPSKSSLPGVCGRTLIHWVSILCWLEWTLQSWSCSKKMRFLFSAFYFVYPFDQFCTSNSDLIFMNSLFIFFLCSLQDETMHSGADVEAFTAALNRDIKGDASTSQPLDETSMNFSFPLLLLFCCSIRSKFFFCFLQSGGLSRKLEKKT